MDFEMKTELVFLDTECPLIMNYYGKCLPDVDASLARSVFNKKGIFWAFSSYLYSACFDVASCLIFMLVLGARDCNILFLFSLHTSLLSHNFLHEK